MSNEQLEDLLMFEHTDIVERNVYDTKKLSKALPFGDSKDLTTSSSSPFSSSPSPSPTSLTQQRAKKQSHHTNIKDEVGAVLRAYFIEGLTMVGAGAKIDMPRTTATKLIRTY